MSVQRDEKIKIPEVKQEGARFRKYNGALGVLVKVLQTSIPLISIFFILRVPSRLGMSLWVEQYLALFLGIVMVLVFLKVPVTKKASYSRLPWYDSVSAVLSAIVFLYLAFYFPDFQEVIGGIVHPQVVLLGIICIMLLIEACRRLFGWLLASLAVAAVLYAIFADVFPYPLTAKALSIPRLAQIIYVDQNGIMGTTTNVAGILVMAFIIFGTLLYATGGGSFIINLALSIFGKMRGGPAKAAVIGTSLYGTLTGVAVAALYTTGILDIPMMKKHGVDSATAAGIESVAATGSLIIPPVMGVVAFIMALYLETTYARVVFAAIIPAALYAFGLYLQVDRYAARQNFLPLSKEEIPSLLEVLREGWPYLISIFILIYTLLISQLDPEYCAIYSAASLLIISIFKKSMRLSLRRLMDSLNEMGESVVEIGAVCALCGIIIGCFLFTGLALSLTEVFIALSGGNVVLLLIMSGLGCILFGMGMPVVAVYIIVAILIAPALIQLEILPMAAHMFIFYYSVLSFLTPPVCLSVYAASAIANANPMQVAGKALRFAIAAYLVPIAFVFDPYLLLQGDLSLMMVLSVISAFMGIALLAVGAEGYLTASLKVYTRALMIALGLMSLLPYIVIKLIGIIAGATLLLALVSYDRIYKKRYTHETL